MATREEIEAQIEAAPEDDAAYLILGDLLQLEGDPRGELIALDAAALAEGGAHRGQWRQRRGELLARHPHLAPMYGPGAHLTWHLGFVRRVALQTSASYHGLLAHPALRFASELVLLDPEAASFIEHVTPIVERMPLVRSLAIGDPERRHYHWPRDRARLDLPVLVPQLPQLEHLYACEPVELGNAPRLRSLRLEGDPEVLTHLETAHLPELAKLSVRDPITRKERAFDRFRWLLDRPPPQLVDLELVGIEGDELVAVLGASPLLRQLRALRLWNANLTIAGARSLARSCGHLDLLDLSDPLLDDDSVALLAGACREVRTVSPWMREITRRG